MANLDLGKIKRNVGRMVAQGAPQADIDRYISLEGATVDQVRDFQFSPQANQRVEAGFAQLPEGSVEEVFDRGTILPFRRNVRTGEVEFDPAGSGITGEIAQAVTLPGDVMRGDVPIRDPLTGNLTEEVMSRADALAAVGGAPIAPGARFLLNRAAQARAARAQDGGDANLPAPLTEATGREVVEAATRQGVTLPRGVASDNPLVQQSGKFAATVPFAGQPLRAAGRRALDDVGEAATRVEQSLGSGSVRAAGTGARRDITSHITDTIGNAISRRFDEVSRFVNPEVTRPLQSTARTVEAITQRRQASASPKESQAVAMVQGALDRPEGLTFEGLKNLRTMVREMLDNPSALPARNISQAELKQIYSALSNDLTATARASGGERAVQALREANRFTQRKSREREALNKIIKPEADERLFDNIVAMAGSNARADIGNLGRARGAVSRETWNDISSAVLSRMGRDAEGNFSPDRFLTAWGKMSPEGKRIMFGSTGRNDVVRALDDIARISSRFKQLNQFANPSGTAQAGMFGAGGALIIPEPMTVLSGLGTSAVISRILSRPATARNASAWARAYENAVRNPTSKTMRVLRSRSQPLAVEIAKEAGDPDLKEQILEGLSVGIAQAGQNGAEARQPLEITVTPNRTGL